jgi:hypothetical protein
MYLDQVTSVDPLPDPDLDLDPGAVLALGVFELPTSGKSWVQ